MSVAVLARRFVALTALRWLPTGLVVPITVLLADARGLTPAEIGLVFTVHSAVVVALELPTGGLADSLGRRAVLATGGLLHVAGLLALVIAEDLLGFCLAYALVGIGRALDSGPLEAWFVDAATMLDPTVDTTPAMARAGVANGTALCLGAVVGGLLPLLADDLLVLPILVAAALGLAHVVAVLLLVVSVGPTRRRRTVRGALHEGLREVPGTILSTLRITRGDRVLRLLLALAFGTGVVLMTLELLVPLRVADLTESREAASSAFGLLVALSFAAAAIGSGLAPRIRALVRGSAPAALTTLFAISALALVGVALAPTVVLIGIPYIAFYLLNGATGPLRKRLMHERVSDAQRATAVSVASLGLQLGAITGNTVQPRLYEQVSPAAAFSAAAAVLAVSAVLALRLRAQPDRRRAREAA